MPSRLEIALKEDLADAEGEGIRHKAKAYFDIDVSRIRTVHVVTIDAKLAGEQLQAIQTGIFTNPVTQISSFDPLKIPFDWIIWVGYRPGVRDNAGSTAEEAIKDLLSKELRDGEAVYTSKRFCISGEGLTLNDMHRIAGELLANDIIQQWKVYSHKDWHPAEGIGFIIPKVLLDHTPTVTTIAVDSDETLRRISDERSLALNPNDIPTIRSYFSSPGVQAERAQVGLSDPTDLELEYISQARSDHCNHNTFRGLFHYRKLGDDRTEAIDNLFKTCIEAPTLELKEKKPWVISVLWDNAGAGRFDEDHYYQP